MDWPTLLNEFGLPIGVIIALIWAWEKRIWPYFKDQIDKKEALAAANISGKEALLKEQVALARATAENSQELHRTCLATFTESRNAFLESLADRDAALMKSLRERDERLAQLTTAIRELNDEIRGKRHPK